MSVPAPSGAAIIISSHRTVELLTPQQTRDVYEILATTAERNVYFQFRYPVYLLSGPNPGPNAPEIVTSADAIAASIDSLFSLPNVVGVSYIQDVSPNNQLIDLVEIYIQSDNGQATDILRWPLESVDLRVVGGPIQTIVTNLNALASSATLAGTAPVVSPAGTSGGAAGG